MTKTTPCAQCPWRRSNQGKRHRLGFYTKKNLARLWNQIRRGGAPQSCHLTDPSHPDHLAVGAKPGSTPQECPGAVIVVLREVEKMAGEKRHINGAGIDRYLDERKRRGLTQLGILYWVVQRIQFAGVPAMGGPKLPDVDVNDAEIGLPKGLENG